MLILLVLILLVSKILLVHFKFYYNYTFTLALFCDQPLDFMNGTVVYSTSIYGTVATYSCSVGFALNGEDQTRTCVGDGGGRMGSFSGTQPNCERKLTLWSSLPVNITNALYHSNHLLCFHYYWEWNDCLLWWRVRAF